MTKTILIAGKKRSGKDHFAKLLKTELEDCGFAVDVMRFADPLKELLAKTLGLTVEQLEEYKNFPDEYALHTVYYDDQHIQRINALNFRQLLQNLGTEAMKDLFGESVWSDLTAKKTKESKADFVIIPDFRFLCEYKGETTIKIRNDDLKTQDDHRSETELDNFEFDYIVNNTCKPDLCKTSKHMAETFIRLLKSAQR